MFAFWHHWSRTVGLFPVMCYNRLRLAECTFLLEHSCILLSSWLCPVRRMSTGMWGEIETKKHTGTHGMYLTTAVSQTVKLFSLFAYLQVRDWGCPVPEPTWAILSPQDWQKHCVITGINDLFLVTTWQIDYSLLFQATSECNPPSGYLTDSVISLCNS